MHFNKHSRIHFKENKTIRRKHIDLTYAVPYALAWTAAAFILIFIIFDLPVLVQPHAVAVVEKIGDLEAEFYADEETNNGMDIINRKLNVYVRYVAMGEERTSVLKNAPGKLEQGDILVVSYSVSDPYEIVTLSIYRYIFHGAIIILCVFFYGYLWHTHNDNRVTV